MYYTMSMATTWIHDKRKTLGLSQSDVAKALGISRPTYTKLETGELKPTLNQKMLLGQVFGISLERAEKLSGFSVKTSTGTVKPSESRPFGLYFAA